MNSTMIRTATPAATCPSAVVDALVLPAAVAAPSALLIAVQRWIAQETTALGRLVAATTGDVAPHATGSAYGTDVMFADAVVVAAVVDPAFRTRTSNDVQGSPPRGRPV